MRQPSRASASSTGRRSKTSWWRIASATVALRDLETGAVRRLSCRYLIGCDGARSIVRKAIGAELSGDAVVQRVQSTYIRAPDLIDRQHYEPAWGTGSINPRRAGMVYAIDGRERWLVHNYMKPGEGDFDSSIAMPASGPSSASARTFNTTSSPGRTGTDAG